MRLKAALETQVEAEQEAVVDIFAQGHDVGVHEQIQIFVNTLVVGRREPPGEFPISGAGDINILSRRGGRPCSRCSPVIKSKRKE